MMYDGRGCHVEQSETCRPNRQEIRSTYNQRFFASLRIDNHLKCLVILFQQRSVRALASG
jgi:hypothetical protein